MLIAAPPVSIETLEANSAHSARPLRLSGRAEERQQCRSAARQILREGASQTVSGTRGARPASTIWPITHLANEKPSVEKPVNCGVPFSVVHAPAFEWFAFIGYRWRFASML